MCKSIKGKEMKDVGLSSGTKIGHEHPCHASKGYLILSGRVYWAFVVYTGSSLGCVRASGFPEVWNLSSQLGSNLCPLHCKVDS